MIRWLAPGAATIALIAAVSVHAEETGAASTTVVPPLPPALTSAAAAAQSALQTPGVASAEAEELRKCIAGLEPGDTDEERSERAALVSFYESRSYAPLWSKALSTELTPSAVAL